MYANDVAEEGEEATIGEWRLLEVGLTIFYPILQSFFLVAFDSGGRSRIVKGFQFFTAGFFYPFILIVEYVFSLALALADGENSALGG